MKRKPTPENFRWRIKASGHGDASEFAVSSANCPKARQVGPMAFSHTNALSITKAEILRITEAIKQAGCRDVLIISTPKYVRFVVTMKFRQPR